MRTDSSVPEFTEDTLTRRLPERLLNNLTAFAASRSIHLSTVMLSCYMVLLSKYTDKEDILTGMPAMVRPEERFDGVVGHFLNMLPIRSRAGRKKHLLTLFKGAGCRSGRTGSLLLSVSENGA